MMTDRQLIDRLVDWRKANRPLDTSVIKLKLTPKAVHEALRLPPPPKGQRYPVTCRWRGYEIRATEIQETTSSGRAHVTAERMPYNDD